jgi:hypothetical protein
MAFLPRRAGAGRRGPAGPRLGLVPGDSVGASIGAAGAGYCFFITTKPYTDASIWMPAWNTEPLVITLAAALAALAWLVLAIPLLVAGFFRLGDWGLGRWLRAVAWAGAWVAGCVLMYLAYVWGDYPSSHLAQICGRGGCVLSYYGPAVVSWGELPICAAWLALAAVMALTLAGPTHGQPVSDTSTEASL